MAAPFVAIQARTSAAVLRHLANAHLILGDGDAAVHIPGIYERAYLEVNGIESTAPSFIIPSAEVAARQIVVGTQLRAPEGEEAAWGSPDWWGGTLFTVRGLDPDGAGLTRLILEAP
jgi:hypothetical protein